MAEVVERGPRQAGPRLRLLQRLRHRVARERGAIRAGEDQVPRGVSGLSRLQPVLGLADLLLLESGDGGPGKRDRPPRRGRLRRPDVPLAVDLLDGLADGQGADVEVDVLPAQAEQLGLSQPRRERRRAERAEAVGVGGGEMWFSTICR